MSVSLTAYKGRRFDPFESKMVFDYPVSFQNIYNDLWEKAISDCKIELFKACTMFTNDNIPQVLDELDLIYKWAVENGGENSNYMSDRIMLLKGLLIGFLYGLEDRELQEYWFDIG